LDILMMLSSLAMACATEMPSGTKPCGTPQKAMANATPAIAALRSLRPCPLTSPLRSMRLLVVVVADDRAGLDDLHLRLSAATQKIVGSDGVRFLRISDRTQCQGQAIGHLLRHGDHFRL